jgi:hypothetical protein
MPRPELFISKIRYLQTHMRVIATIRRAVCNYSMRVLRILSKGIGAERAKAIICRRHKRKNDTGKLSSPTEYVTTRWNNDQRRIRVAAESYQAAAEHIKKIVFCPTNTSLNIDQQETTLCAALDNYMIDYDNHDTSSYLLAECSFKARYEAGIGPVPTDKLNLATKHILAKRDAYGIISAMEPLADDLEIAIYALGRL